MAAHLATTPTLQYTTDLRRSNTSVDPVEDFLFHTKAGHCERFAAALVLMLRSQRIPAVLVLGFKGCEHVENGRYVIRQEHAHVWVETLVPVPGRPLSSNPMLWDYHWLTLDPTPSGAGIEAHTDRGWLGRAGAWVGSFFREYVTHYTPEQRQKAIADLTSALVRPETPLALVALVGLALGARSARRRWGARATRAEPPPALTRWLGELVRLLAAHGITPTTSETPLEFARRVAGVLRDRPGCAGVVEVPLAWAEAYYQDRFGGVPPGAARRGELDAGLAALRRALESRGT
jgi:hypothetical protein